MSSKVVRGASPDQIAVWQPAITGAAPGRPAAPTTASPSREPDQQMQQREQAAYQRGLQEGEARARQQGAAQAQAELQAALGRIGKTVDEISSLRSRLRHEAEEDVVKLAMAIARRILNRELATDPGALLGLVRSALDKLDGRELHRVRLNPQDAPVVQQFLQTLGTPRKIELFPDPALARGSAILESNHGSLDASIDTQLNEIARGFADLVRRS